MSLPTRERELKSSIDGDGNYFEASLPTRERELKFSKKKKLRGS